LFFAGEIFNKDILFNLIKAFLSFSFLASAVYIINDISDLKSDREHSWKSFRPLAIGILKKRDAVLFAISLIVLSLALAYGLNMLYFMLFLYFFINILYTFKIKKKNILDIILIAFLYCIRILVGGLVSGVYISPWIILTVFFGALFITSCKRYSQIKNNNQKTLFGYDENLINFTMLFSAILSSGTYGIWSILEHKNTFLVYSTIPVVFVVFKMVEYTYKFPERSESPEILVFKDRWILATFCIWLLFVFYIFYLI
jgi:4-hydroxybenzoate polyprenyltransferase